MFYLNFWLICLNVFSAARKGASNHLLRNEGTGLGETVLRSNSCLQCARVHRACSVPIIALTCTALPSVYQYCPLFPSPSYCLACSTSQGPQPKTKQPNTETQNSFSDNTEDREKSGGRGRRTQDSEFERPCFTYPVAWLSSASFGLLWS